MTLRTCAGVTGSLAHALKHTVTHPLAVTRDAVGAALSARSALRQIVIIEPAHPPLWSGRRSLRRHFETFSLDLDQARAAAHALGGTAGTAFNATLMTSGPNMDIGVNIDPAAVPDPELLRAWIIDSIEGLVAAGS